MRVSDEELFVRYRGGDMSAFSELVTRFKAPLFTVIFRLVGQREAAEDIFQETFFRVLQNADRFDAGLRFSSWVFSIALNLCRDHLRREKRRPMEVVAELPDLPGGPTPETETWRQEVRKALAQAVEKLPPEQKEVFVLREFGGLSFQEIAQLVEANLNTVLGRMRLALVKLRQELAGFMETSQ